MKYVYKDEDESVEYTLELRKITPGEFIRFRKNNTLVYDEDGKVFRLHGDIVAEIVLELPIDLIFNAYRLPLQKDTYDDVWLSPEAVEYIQNQWDKDFCHDTRS